MQIKLPRPTEKQALFLKETKPRICYGGARAGGKSTAIRMKAVLLGLHYPGIQMLLLRRTYPELYENHILELQKLTRGVCTYNDSKKSMHFPNGSRIKFGYCATESDVLQYQGQQYDVIFMDEATQFTEMQYIAISEINRNSNDIQCRFRPRMYLSANPGGVGHAWVKRLFIDRHYQGYENPEDYVFIKATIYDNKPFMKKDPNYVNVLKALPEKRRKAMLDGNWDVYEGQYFSMFDRNVHVAEPFKIPDWWEQFRAFDYGRDMFHCLWFAVDPQGQVYVTREFAQSDLLLKQAAEKALARTPCEEAIRYTVAGADLWNTNQDSGYSGAEIMAQAGLRRLIKADMNRVGGWRALSDWLQPEGNKARLKIFRNCSELIRELTLLQFDPIKSEDVATQPHEITHGPDALRYGIMSRPRISKLPRKHFTRENSFEPEVKSGQKLPKATKDFFTF